MPTRSRKITKAQRLAGGIRGVDCAGCGKRFVLKPGQPDTDLCKHCRPRWWSISQQPRYNGRPIWVPVPNGHIRVALAAGLPMRLAVERDIHQAGLLTPDSVGPTGKPLCCWCGTEVSGRRQCWCSDQCVQEYRTCHDWGYIRGLVRERDAGVCCSCGVDTNQARRWWRRVAVAWQRISRRDPAAIRQAMRACGWPGDTCRDWWEADHIHARADGGSDHPDNLQTQCVPCHKARTRKQAGERARKRREQRPMPLLDAASKGAK